MGNSTDLGMSFCSSKTRIVLIGRTDDIKMAGKEKSMAPMWKRT